MRIHFLIGSAMLLIVLSFVGFPAGAAAPTGSSMKAEHLVVPPPRAARSRPLIAILADNAGAQTTDFMVPYGILKDADVAEVRSVSTREGAIRLTRGLTIMADETLAAFDVREAAGADIVIVPAQAKPKTPAVSAWLRAQAAKGAVIVSVCEGARVLAHAGLLQGKTAVTYWASLNSMEKAFPSTRWVRDRRYVQDGPIISTAGVTASIPMTLALVEAIGGHAVAQATAKRFGVEAWNSSHRTGDFRIEKADLLAASAARKKPQETTEIPIEDGVDEVSLAFQTEIWGRSERSRVVATHPDRAPIRSRHGLLIVPDAEARAGNHLAQLESLPPARQLEATLAAVAARYGIASARLATLGMEYDPAPSPNLEGSEW